MVTERVMTVSMKTIDTTAFAVASGRLQAEMTLGNREGMKVCARALFATCHNHGPTFRHWAGQLFTAKGVKFILALAKN